MLLLYFQVDDKQLMTIVENVVEEKLAGVYTLLEQVLKETMNVHDETRTIANLIKIRLQDHNESRKAVLHHPESLQRKTISDKLHADYDNIFNDEIEEDIEERSPIWDRQFTPTPLPPTEQTDHHSSVHMWQAARTYRIVTFHCHLMSFQM